MKITEMLQRECCHREDLRPVEGTDLRGRDPVLMFCVHCGHRHQIHTYTDAAGSAEWEYRKLEETR